MSDSLSYATAPGRFATHGIAHLPFAEQLLFERFGRGFAWLDTGTHDSLLDASQYVQTIEHRQGLKVACLEEIAYENGWISRELLLERASYFGKTGYGQYLFKLAEAGK